MDLLIVTTPGHDQKALKEIVELFPQAQVLDFYTSVMDELHLIAKYRILPVDSVLILDGQKVVGRIVGRSFAADVVKATVSLLES
jgi:hypothetical protein